MTDWLGNLSVGDVVYIRILGDANVHRGGRLWREKVRRNGELWRVRVTRRNLSGDIVIQGYGCFCKETAHKNSDTMLEKPCIAIEIEYILQRLSEMRDTYQGTRTCIKVEYDGKEVKQRGFSGEREVDRV